MSNPYKTKLAGLAVSFVSVAGLQACATTSPPTVNPAPPPVTQTTEPPIIAVNPAPPKPVESPPIIANPAPPDTTTQSSQSAQ